MFKSSFLLLFGCLCLMLVWEVVWVFTRRRRAVRRERERRAAQERHAASFKEALRALPIHIYDSASAASSGWGEPCRSPQSDALSPTTPRTDTVPSTRSSLPEPAVAVAEGSPLALEDSEEHEPCSICLAVYLAGEELRELPCGHRFHAACIDCWLLSKCGDCSSADLPCCPLCKDVPLMLARAIEQRDLDAQRPQAAAPESTGPRDYSLEQIVARLWHRLCRARPLAVASSYLASVLKRVLEWRPLLATGTVAAPPTAAPRPNRLTSLRPIPPFNAGGNLPPGFIVV